MTVNNIINNVVNDKGLKAWCIANVQQRLEDLEHLEEEERLEELEKVKIQVYGLRDLFWLFSSDQIDDIVAPIGEAIKRAELELEGGE